MSDRAREYPRTPEDLRAAVVGPGDPFEDALLKDGSRLTETEYRSLAGSPAHLDNRHPAHAATVERTRQGVETEARPATPEPLATPDGGSHQAAVAWLGEALAATAKRDGVEPTVKSAQMAMNSIAADWAKEDPQRPGPLLNDGLYGPKTDAALRRHLALRDKQALMDEFDSVHLATTGKVPLRPAPARPAPGRHGALGEAARRNAPVQQPVMRSDDRVQAKKEEAGFAAAVPVVDATVMALAAGFGALAAHRMGEEFRKGDGLLPGATIPGESKPRGFRGMTEEEIERLRKEVGTPLIRLAKPQEIPEYTGFPIPDEPQDLLEILLPPIFSKDHFVLYNRRGSPRTQDQNTQVAQWGGELSSERGLGIKHTGGGRDASGTNVPETYLKGPGGSRSGSSYLDVTFEGPDGRRCFVNTVDSKPDQNATSGFIETTRERNAAIRVLINAENGDILVLIAKAPIGWQLDEKIVKEVLSRCFDHITAPGGHGKLPPARMIKPVIR